MKKLLLLFMIVFSFQLAFAKGEDFSNIKLKDIHGKEYTFGKDDRVSYVKLWTSWCPVCLVGLDELDEFSSKERDYNVLTVVFPGDYGEKTAEDFKKWYEELGYKNIKVLLDEKGEIAELMKLRAFPTSVILDKDGKVTKVIIGDVKPEKVDKFLSK